MRRMTFEGLDEIVESMNKKNKDFCFIYLGHYCNWEWIASLPYWISKDISCGQIYHPLYNQAFDKLFLRLRNQFGGECIPMKTTLRRIIELKRTKQKAIIGFISDQAPKWNSCLLYTSPVAFRHSLYLPPFSSRRRKIAFFQWHDHPDQTKQRHCPTCT